MYIQLTRSALKNSLYNQWIYNFIHNIVIVLLLLATSVHWKNCIYEKEFTLDFTWMVLLIHNLSCVHLKATSIECGLSVIRMWSYLIQAELAVTRMAVISRIYIDADRV